MYGGVVQNSNNQTTTQRPTGSHSKDFINHNHNHHHHHHHHQRNLSSDQPTPDLFPVVLESRLEWNTIAKPQKNDSDQLPSTNNNNKDSSKLSSAKCDGTTSAVIDNLERNPTPPPPHPGGRRHSAPSTRCLSPKLVQNTCPVDGDFDYRPAVSTCSAATNSGADACSQTLTESVADVASLQTARAGMFVRPQSPLRFEYIRKVSDPSQNRGGVEWFSSPHPQSPTAQRLLRLVRGEETSSFSTVGHHHHHHVLQQGVTSTNWNEPQPPSVVTGTDSFLIPSSNLRINPNHPNHPNQLSHSYLMPSGAQTSVIPGTSHTCTEPNIDLTRNGNEQEAPSTTTLDSTRQLGVIQYWTNAKRVLGKYTTKLKQAMNYDQPSAATSTPAPAATENDHPGKFTCHLESGRAKWTESTAVGAGDGRDWSCPPETSDEDKQKFFGKTFLLASAAISSMLLCLILVLIFAVTIPHRIESVLHNTALRADQIKLFDITDRIFHLEVLGQMDRDSSAIRRVSVSFPSGLEATVLGFDPQQDLRALAKRRILSKSDDSSSESASTVFLHPELLLPDDDGNGINWWDPATVRALSTRSEFLGILTMNPLATAPARGAVDLFGKFEVENPDEFKSFVHDVFQGRQTAWFLSGKAQVRVLGLLYKHIPVNRIVVIEGHPIFGTGEIPPNDDEENSIRTMREDKLMPLSEEDTTVEKNRSGKSFAITELDFTGRDINLPPESIVKGGQPFRVTALLNNQGKVTVEDLGTLRFHVILQDQVVALLDLETVPFETGINQISVVGQLMPDQGDATSFLANRFLDKGPVDLVIKLASSTAGKCNVFSRALENLTFPSTLGDLAAENASLQGQTKKKSLQLLKGASATLIRVTDPLLHLLRGELYDPQDGSQPKKWTSPIPPLPPMALQRRLSPAERSVKRELARLDRRVARRRRRQLKTANRRRLTEQTVNDEAQDALMQAASDLIQQRRLQEMQQNGSLLANLLGNIGNIRTNVVNPMLQRAVPLMENFVSNTVNNAGRSGMNEEVPQVEPNLASAEAPPTQLKPATVVNGMQNLISGVALAALDTIDVARGGHNRLAEEPSVAVVQPDLSELSGMQTVEVGSVAKSADEIFVAPQRLRPIIRWKSGPEAMYKNVEDAVMSELNVEGEVVVGIWKPFETLNVSNLGVQAVVQGAAGASDWVRMGALDVRLDDAGPFETEEDRKKCESLLPGFEDGKSEQMGVIMGETSIMKLHYEAAVGIEPSMELMGMVRELLGGGRLRLLLTEMRLTGNIQTGQLAPIMLKQEGFEHEMTLPVVADFSDMKVLSFSLGDTKEITIRIEVEFKSGSPLNVDVGPIYLDWVYEDYHMGPVTILNFTLKRGLNKIVIYAGLYPGARVMMKAASLFANLMGAPSMTVCVAGRSYWSDEERETLIANPGAPSLNVLVNRMTEQLSTACSDIPNPGSSRLTDALIPMVGQIMRSLMDRSRSIPAAGV